ncbi:response regulator [Carboxylicivirga mesophila]|uniref:histidine kinase n=1 Tax=Carboxylicivirga mesophila TaxID=1166478 RepID=A0ABS5K4N3_9BACT|nr:response regulator [Carboxylicivirga mesophila]MBS2209927.1 response regulator [Carboxylicivirga mesophila]
MKRAFVIAFISIAFLVVSNVYYYLDTYQWQINSQKDVLLKQSLMVRDKLSQFANKTNTGISILISQKELDSLFISRQHSFEVQKRLELLYNGFSEHLNDLTVYDTRGHAFELKRTSNGTFISAFGHSDNIGINTAKILINPQGTRIIYIQPLLTNDEIIGYVKFNMDLNLFFSSVFHNFNVEDVNFQWVMKPNGEVVFNTLHQNKFIPNLRNIDSQITRHDWFSDIHYLNIDGKKIKVLTVFSKLYFDGIGYYLAFSMPQKIITASIARYSFLVGGISLFIICLIILTFSIYQRRQAEDEQTLKQSEEALRKMVYYMPVGVVLIDSRNRIRQVNKAALKLFAFDDEDQLVGRIASDNILFENKTRLDKTTYSSQSNKYILKSKTNEESVILNEQIPFYLLRERYSLQVFMEVTSLENERKSEEMANKAKSTFIANISHELRTPLNGIIGMTDILLSSEKDEQDRSLLGIVKRSADTLLVLINDILDFSKMEAGRFEIESIPFDLHDEVENTIQSFMPKAHDKGLELTWTSMTQLPKHYLGDQIRVRQILNNLLSNAIKFTNQGRIHLSVKQARGINGSPAILFSLKDSGIGIKKEKLETIFNSFAQEDESTTRKYGGSGLGITISKQLVNMMGGEIWVNSPSGISSDPANPGAEFAFTIPYKSKTHQKHFNYSHIHTLKKVRAFIISDEPLQVRVLMKNLASLHIDYKVIPPSIESIDIIGTDNKHHLLIVDHRPDFNGLEFLQTLYNNRLHKRMPIIMQSSDFEPSNTALAKKLGVDVYLRKPVELTNLEECIIRFFPGIPKRRTAIGEPSAEQSLKILLAEDNVLNQRIAKSLFNKIGHKIDVVSNGVDAVEKMQRNKYDIVFMDILMPQMDGIEALQKMRKTGDTCPVIAMTASIEETERERVLKAGMDDFITKPTKVEDLSRMLTKWCQI